MCTGTGASNCPPETLAWQLYEEYGYRPVELRPCMKPSRSVGLGDTSTTSPMLIPTWLIPTWLRQRLFRRRHEGHSTC
jgi:hypothetical protein